MEEPIPKADVGDKTEQVVNLICLECLQYGCSCCLPSHFRTYFADIYSLQPNCFLSPWTLCLDGVCQSNIKLTVTLEATTVYENLLGPPLAQYCVQQTRLLHQFWNGYACFFSKRTEALVLLTGFRGSELRKQNLTAIPRDKNSESFIYILQSGCIIPEIFPSWTGSTNKIVPCWWGCLEDLCFWEW